MTGMVTDKEVSNNFEDVWISVYEWLKNGDNANQIILRIKGSATDRELDLGTGEEVDKLPSTRYFLELTQLRGVIAIAKQVHAGTVDITIPSIEMYDNGARFYVYPRGTMERVKNLQAAT